MYNKQTILDAVIINNILYSLKGRKRSVYNSSQDVKGIEKNF